MLTEPLEHQKPLLKRLEKETSFGILWDMGLGKTWIGCSLIEKTLLPELKAKRKSNKKFLIICPNSVTDTWLEQIEEHTEISSDRVCILRAKGQSVYKRREHLEDPKYNIFIINFEGLTSLMDDFLTMEFEIIFADESQRIKTYDSQRTKSACAIALKAKRKFILSGTPMTKSYLDFYPQWYFMGRHVEFGIPPKLSLRAGFFVFRATFLEDKNVGRYRGQFPDWQLREGAKNEIDTILAQGSNRLEKTDCLKLPKRLYKTLRCEMSDEQSKVYAELKQECFAYIENDSVTVQQAIVKMIRLNQITSGFVPLDGEKSKHEFKTNTKLNLCIETVDEILDNPKNKIIIWAHFRHDVKKLVKVFEAYKPLHIYGGTDNRGQIRKDFQNKPEHRIFIGNPKSAGLGLTLTAANYCIFYSYNFSSEDRQQAEDRNYRKGSEIHKSIICIDLIMKNTIDEAILGSLRGKKDMIQSVMDYIKNNG